MSSKKPLIIFGDSAFAEVAHEYFSADSPYQVEAFTVSRQFLKHKTKFNLPIVAFETVQKTYPPSKYSMHIALVYNQLNRNRAKFYFQAKHKGYHLANYISTRAFIWKNVKFGDNNFIFEDNTIQPFVTIGSNTVLWSGNHIGHHSTIGNHCFISSHVVVSGFCNIGDYCFMGVNSSVANNTTVAKDNIIGANALIVKDTKPGELYRGLAATPDSVSTYIKFGVKST